MANELKSCPFCGGSVEVCVGVLAGVTMIECGECGATVSFGGKGEWYDAVDAWNRRAAREEESNQ